MNNIDKEKVIKYMDEWNMNHPLVFKGYEPEKNPLEGLSTLSSVLEVLRLSGKYPSYLFFEGQIDGFETYQGCWRSVGDIWRHVVYFRPEITIFDVMDCIYENYEEFVGHYCDTVGRMVFHPASFYDEEDFTGIYTQDGDEFGIGFDFWGKGC